MISARSLLSIAAIFLAVQTSDAAVKRGKIPIWFDVVGDGVELLPVELDYDLSSQDHLKFGPHSISAENFRIRIGTPQQMSPTLKPAFPPEDFVGSYFLIQWPDNFFFKGLIEMISRSGKVVWTQNFNEEKLENWQKLQKKYEIAATKNGIATTYKSSFFSSSKFGVKNILEENPEIKKMFEPFRFCISRVSEVGSNRLCSQMYEFVNVKGNFLLDFFPKAPSPARVIAFNESAPLKNVVVVPVNKMTQFYAELSNGISYEFVSQPIKINLVEMTESKAPDAAELVAWGDRPYQASRVLNPPQESAFTKLIGFQQTIGDMRQFWSSRIVKNRPEIYIPGKQGGVFKQKMTITKLPREEFRQHLYKPVIDGTYIDGAKIHGVRAANTEITTKQNEIAFTNKKSADFTWWFGARDRGKMNRSYLNVKAGEQDFKSYFEIFKGYPREFSFRTTGLLNDQKELVLSGEAAFNYWFEDIFGWTNPTFSRHRWGLSLKFFQTLTDYSIVRKRQALDDTTLKGTLQSTTIDLKYRLSQGLWNRDESWGFLAGYQNVKFVSFDGKMMGPGFFWARSMPRVFDELFNIVPYMRYPKWVDMEFIYFASALDSKTQLDAFKNYSVNFHGKVLWKDWLFGEAGFGLKSVSFQSGTTTARERLGYIFLYGTMGLGIQF